MYEPTINWRAKYQKLIAKLRQAIKDIHLLHHQFYFAIIGYGLININQINDQINHVNKFLSKYNLIPVIWIEQLSDHLPCGQDCLFNTIAIYSNPNKLIVYYKYTLLYFEAQFNSIIFRLRKQNSYKICFNFNTIIEAQDYLQKLSFNIEAPFNKLVQAYLADELNDVSAYNTQSQNLIHIFVRSPNSYQFYHDLEFINP